MLLVNVINIWRATSAKTGNRLNQDSEELFSCFSDLTADMNAIPAPSVSVVPPQPTYGFLIDLLENAEELCRNHPQLCLKHVVAAWFELLYPSSIQIIRPCRFEVTLRRIAAPAQPSTRGKGTLTGEEFLSIGNGCGCQKFAHPMKTTQVNTLLNITNNDDINN